MKRVQKGHVTLKWYVVVGGCTDPVICVVISRVDMSLPHANAVVIVGTWEVSLGFGRCGNDIAEG